MPLKGQRWQEVLDKTKEAQAEPSPKNLYDTYWIHNLAGKANTGLKKYREAVNEFELIKDTPCMTEPERGELLKLMTKIYYQLDDYPKVIEAGNRSLADLLPMPTSRCIWVRRTTSPRISRTRARSWTGVVAKLEAEGKPPGEQNLRLIHGSCVSLGDDDCVTMQYEKLVKFYPKPEYWQNLVNTLFNDKKSTDKHQLNVMRLAMHVECDQRAFEVRRGRADRARSGPARRSAGDHRRCDEPKAVHRSEESSSATRACSTRAKTAAAGDKATLAQQEAAAKANAAGNADVKLGAAYLSYGDNAKAIEALQRGIGKSGVRDPDEAGILLGIAYLRSGNKAEAAKAFGTVTQGSDDDAHRETVASEHVRLFRYAKVGDRNANIRHLPPRSVLQTIQAAETIE